jgi:hypothetical protein
MQPLIEPMSKTPGLLADHPYFSLATDLEPTIASLQRLYSANSSPGGGVPFDAYFCATKLRKGSIKPESSSLETASLTLVHRFLGFSG